MEAPNFWVHDVIRLLDGPTRLAFSAASHRAKQQMHQQPYLQAKLRIRLTRFCMPANRMAVTLASSLPGPLHLQLVIGSMNESKLEDFIKGTFSAKDTAQPSLQGWRGLVSAVRQVLFIKPGATMCPIIQALPCVQSLSLEGQSKVLIGRACRTCTRGPRGLVPEYLGHYFPNLQSVSLINMKLKLHSGNHPLAQNGEPLSQFPKLNKLVMSNVTLKEELEFMSAFTLDQLTALPALTALSLTSCNVLEQCNVGERALLFSRLTSLSLPELDDIVSGFANVHWQTETPRLQPTQPYLALTHLTLHACTITSDQQLSALLTIAPNVTHLTLKGIDSLSRSFINVPCAWESLSVARLNLKVVPKLPLSTIKHLEYRRLNYSWECVSPLDTLDDLQQSCRALPACERTPLGFAWLWGSFTWHVAGSEAFKRLLPDAAVLLVGLATRCWGGTCLELFVASLQAQQFMSRSWKIKEHADDDTDDDGAVAGSDWEQELRALVCESDVIGGSGYVSLFLMSDKL